ncbi:MAG TPA: hypothetical protein VKA21_17000 [Candidatus Binatia bacterium]|nr:hypothetical protein [Candidatus Binatia bacterium]
MPSFDFDKFLKSFKGGIVDLATKEGKEFVDEARRDGNAFVKKVREDIQTWGSQLASGELSKKDFEFLLKGKRDLAEMNALKEAGLAKIRIDRIVDGMIQVAVVAAKGAAAV